MIYTTWTASTTTIALAENSLLLAYALPWGSYCASVYWMGISSLCGWRSMILSRYIHIKRKTPYQVQSPYSLRHHEQGLQGSLVPAKVWARQVLIWGKSNEKVGQSVGRAGFNSRKEQWRGGLEWVGAVWAFSCMCFKKILR